MQHSTSHSLLKVCSTCKYHGNTTHIHYAFSGKKSIWRASHKFAEGNGRTFPSTKILDYPVHLHILHAGQGKPEKLSAVTRLGNSPEAITWKSQGKRIQPVTSSWLAARGVSQCKSDGAAPRAPPDTHGNCVGWNSYWLKITGVIPSTHLPQEPLKNLLYSQREARKRRFVLSMNLCSHGKLHQSVAQQRWELELAEQEEQHLQGK